MDKEEDTKKRPPSFALHGITPDANPNNGGAQQIPDSFRLPPPRLAVQNAHINHALTANGNPRGLISTG
jgi:hypothetical protein